MIGRLSVLPVGFLLTACTQPKASVSAPDPTSDRHRQCVAISNVTIIDPLHASVAPNMTVIVAGSRITAVAPAKSLRPPAGCKLVDGTGKYLLSGLWDMHAHLFYTGPNGGRIHRRDVYFPLYVANGVTGLRNMFTTPADLMLVNTWNRDIARRTMIGPHIDPVAVPLDGRPKTYPSMIEVATPTAARDAVDSLLRNGLRTIKIASRLSREAYFAVADEVQRQKAILVGHLPVAVRAAEASDAGQRSIEHFSTFIVACSADEEALMRANQEIEEAYGQGVRVGSRPGEILRQTAQTFSPQKCAALGKQFARNGTWLTPTLVQSLSRLIPPEEALADPRLRYLPPAVALRWRNRFQALRAEGNVAAAPSRPNALHAIVVALRRAGAGILVGTDANWDLPSIFPGFGVHDEMELLVRAGFTPMEALEAATANPARYLNATKSYGSVEAGKIADLLLLNANPLEDIHNTREIRAVVVNGTLLDRSALDRMLSEVEAAVQR